MNEAKRRKGDYLNPELADSRFGRVWQRVLANLSEAPDGKSAATADSSARRRARFNREAAQAKAWTAAHRCRVSRAHVRRSAEVTLQVNEDEAWNRSQAS